MPQAVELHIVVIDVGTYDFLSVRHVIYDFSFTVQRYNFFLT